MSIRCPQRPLVTGHQPRSCACGFVDNRSPQTVDRRVSTGSPAQLSTGYPQLRPGCPQDEPSSPHRCPLFGNATHLLTGSSERRHTKRAGCPVGNLGKAGDSAGEKWPSPVYRLCRTFRCPQRSLVFHRPRPQDPWTKSGL
ncbi:hypothetical protein DY218_12145 [Streptomyces triticagri]|uniref:Uncharacterized protein n=1 Tax=Streptomyces triticagri TaxID=2293568 RepID=A0A372M692_9ACTN|nr:hypothetical protein DY218_12145 [Streptomyces triticagri]